MLFLINLGLFDDIIQKCLVSGHSFLARDSDFTIIKKRRQICQHFSPSQLQEIVRKAKLTNPFRVILMDDIQFFSFKDIANNFLNTIKLPISTCSMIKVSSLTLEKVYYTKTFSDEEHCKDKNIFKRNATTDQLKNQTLIPMLKPTLLSEKKKDLLAIISFLPEEHIKFNQNKTL